MRTDEELNTTFKIFFDDKGYLNVKFLDPVNDSVEDNVKRATIIREKVFEILDKNPDSKYKIIVDTLDMGKSELPNESNKIYQEVARRKEFEKVAVVGDPDEQTNIVKYVLPFIHLFIKKVSWFPNIEEAYIWFSSG